MSKEPTRNDENLLASYFRRYHEVQKGDIASTQVNMKAFWENIHQEVSQTSKDDPGTIIDESKLSDVMSREALASSSETVMSAPAVKVMSKACEIFVLELAMRAFQAKSSNDNTLTKEDVIRALMTSEPHDMFVP
mmetsp:Transcript_95016/g.186452  ORF Transcript_95016/g.186452 Transcript_95016/m.186452 type:complete len:135 (-) Transcript_95016:2-406(-)